MKRPMILLMSFLLYSSDTLSNKVLIITHAFNRPDFIALQDKTFKAFLKDDYEFVVFNDASDPKMNTSIKQMCKKLNIECIRVPQEMHRSNLAGDRHSDGLELCLTTKGHNHNGIVFIIDSDMFLIKPFSIADFVGDYDLAGVPQGVTKNNIHVEYIWPGILFMNMKTLPNKNSINLRGGTIEGVSADTGGNLHHYLAHNPSLKIKRFSCPQLTGLPTNLTDLKKIGHDDLTAQFILDYQKLNDPYAMEFHGESNFIHYRAACNWIGEPASYHAIKSALLNKYIDKAIAQKGA